MKFLLVLSFLLPLTSMARAPLSIKDKPMQAKRSFELMKIRGIEEKKLTVSQIESLAQSMVDSDYTSKKIYTKEVYVNLKRIGNFTCKKFDVLVSGENHDIAVYATENSLSKKKQIIYGFLGTSYSTGASLYEGHTCEIDL